MEVKKFDCNFCKKNFPSENSILMHMEGKKHLKMVEQQNDILCGIYITDFSYNQTKEDALQYFSKFGGIKKSIVGPTMSYMIIVYEQKEEAAKVLSQQHFLGGKRLRVVKRLPRTNYEPPDHGDDEEVNRKLLQLLKDKKNHEKVFKDQIDQFVEFMTPDLHQVSAIYNKVSRDVFHALKNFSMFSKFHIYNFGSSMTHLQFKFSDLDIYIDIIDKPKSEEKYLKNIALALRQSKLFYKIFEISSAKIPIVKAIHKETNMKCDINFKNMLGVENSKLISYYLSLDHKLRSVMLVIKYWAKIQEISGRNHLFTSYSMAMMFIFYLQQCHSFPSVYDLQKNTQPTNPKVIWNMNINPIANTSEINKIKSISMLDILKGFFEYYSTFDFESQIICPYLGKAVPKNCFSEISTVPEQFGLYIKNLDVTPPLNYDKHVCLQDPFELNVNTCTIIFKNILDRYIAACSCAVKKLSKKEEINLLIDLFSVIKLDTPPSKKKKVDDPDFYTIWLKKPKMESSENYSSEAWFQQTLDYCCIIFEKILRLDLTENHKRARVCDETSVDCSNIKMFRALSFVNMWDSRNLNELAIKDDLKNCTTSLEKETLLSEHIWKENEKIRPSVPLFECNITLSCRENPPSVKIELFKTQSYKKIFKSFAIYVNNKIPQWFLLHEQETAKKK